ncbi:hypothetical protein [Clostridium saccharoperbutylacetonicum]|uniref:hypothetical protein n=1 Tax=Clostridium saccharoperbutylacetonicum TaxID=36745 RepID=UPI00098408CD|nr:hypothetical protein [Clostridium saccharoperbutylacetonicum]AQR94259.1 hypothetical protein CLSAP_15660 [Clostridium saccharoperbutylacetonicum]NSB29959.1 hypothetical protein [Clostridium saccharoperbutylacetonicum]
MYSYYTKIDIETCKRLIEMQIWSQSYQMGGIRGKVYYDSNDFQISKSRINSRSQTGRVFYGKFIEKDSGTIINGEFSLDTGVALFAGFLFTFGIVIWLYYFLNFFLGMSNDNISSLLVLIGMPIFLGFGMLGVKLGDKEEEKNYILYIIATTLNATINQDQGIE